MCKAFSCVIKRSGKVYWKLGIDSHEDIISKFKLDRENKKRNQCAIEISPKNNNYIEPDEWVFKFDDDCPDWWKLSHEKACWSAHKEWNKQLRKKLYINRLKNLIHPFNDIPMVKKPTKQHIKLLKQWDSVVYSVRDSVGDSVWSSVGDSVWSSVGYSVWSSVGSSVRDSVWSSVGYSVWSSVGDSVWSSVGYSVWSSVGSSVRDSVGDSVWSSVGDSVWSSVGDSVWSSVGSSVRDSVWSSVWSFVGYNFKISRNKWKYTKNIKTKDYPFMPVVKLWKQGLVPSFDGEYWRLHSGKKGKVIFKISKMKLKEYKKTK